jgi:hypothetical protein
MGEDWKQQFRTLFKEGVERHKAGRQISDTMFEADEIQFLEFIGCSSQEMFDFCDDYVRWDDVIYDHVEELQTVRYEYFKNELNSKPASRRMEMDEFPAKSDEVEGIAWLPRLIVKARAKLDGQLPADLMYG